MIECAFYGMAKEKFGWKAENCNRIEKIYSNGKQRMYAHINTYAINNTTRDANKTPGWNYKDKEDLDSSADDESDSSSKIIKEEDNQVVSNEIIFREVPDRNKQRT